MLSHYLNSPPALVERLSNHLSPPSTEEAKKRINQYLRRVESVIRRSDTTNHKRDQILVIGDDACKMDPLLAELDKLAQTSNVREGSRSLT
jgi:hypothetical protein